MPAHVAPLWLQFIPPSFAPEYIGDLLVSIHGSWNSTVPVGYKVVKLQIENGEVKKSDDFITGLIKGRGVVGRPVDLEFDTTDNLYLSDDRAGMIYKIFRLAQK